jgi:2-polyprenyl-3-methyl-5-hydroxy-6-metoxy-1,4-benzoquinol methylase
MKKERVNSSKARLIEEASSFDRQISERAKHGHIPDLQRSERCEWFYNNVWRDPVYADMVFGQIVRQIKAALENYSAKSASDINILEVACGPGHITLELSRNGYNVLGLDISSSCIELAKKTSEDILNRKIKSRLEYVVGDFYEFQPEKKFDIVVFSCSLHHFGNIDTTLAKVNNLLKLNGLIFISEPTKTLLSDAEAAFVYFIRSLLSLGNNYYQKVGVPDDYKEFKDNIDRIKNEFCCKDGRGNNIQSPMDNELSYKDMYPALSKHFDELENTADFAFFQHLIGGLRLDSIEEERKVAKWIFQIDKLLVSSGLLRPQQFHFVGKKK